MNRINTANDLSQVEHNLCNDIFPAECGDFDEFIIKPSPRQPFEQFDGGYINDTSEELNVHDIVSDVFDGMNHVRGALFNWKPKYLEEYDDEARHCLWEHSSEGSSAAAETPGKLSGWMTAVKWLALGIMPTVLRFFYNTLVVNKSSAHRSRVRHLERLKRERISKRLHEEQHQTLFDAEYLKSVFETETNVLKPRFRSYRRKNHTHPMSAAWRSAASSTMAMFCQAIGAKPLFYQMSKTDQRRGYDGSRDYFWGKDLKAIPREMQPKKNHVICLVDVDYYMEDLEEFLTEYDNPFLLYTIVPESAASEGCGGEDAMSWTPDNEVQTIVSGGGMYRHKIWQWSIDILKIDAVGETGRKVKIFKVLKRRVTDNRYLIALIPQNVWQAKPSIADVYVTHGLSRAFTDVLLERLAFRATRCVSEVAYNLTNLGLATKEPRPDWWTETVDLASDTLAASSLERLEPVVNVGESWFVRLTLKRKDGVYVSTARAGEAVSVTIPAVNDSALASLFEKNKNLVHNPHSVLQYCPGITGSEDEKRAVAWIVGDYHRQQVKHAGPLVYCLEEGVRTYDFAKEVDPNPKTKLIPFMKPLLPGSFDAAVTKTNEEVTIFSRLVRVRSDIKDMNYQMKQHLEYFIELMKTSSIGESRISPTDVEVVMERQNRPSQRVILERGMNSSVEAKAEYFQKAESYAGIKPPRGITQADPGLKVSYSRYLYALSDEVLKKMEWYAFGHSPLRIAQKVAGACKRAESHWVDSDFSRMDGHISPLLRQVDRFVMVALFKPEHHEEMVDLMKQTYDIPVRARQGTRFNMGSAQGSGYPDTSAFNTIRNAFIAFHALLTEEHTRRTPEEAWKALGVYGGDDGGTADIDPVHYVKIAGLFGQDLKASTTRKGDFGVSFLARIYGPHVWQGDPNSCCDLIRQLSKFHVTVRLPEGVTPLMKLKEKVRSFMMTDSQTPVLGDYVSKAAEVLKVSPEDEPDDQVITITTWFARCSPDEAWPNYRDEWMVEYAAKLDLDMSGLETWMDELDIEGNPMQLLGPPAVKLKTDPGVPEFTCKLTEAENTVIVTGKEGWFEASMLRDEDPLAMYCRKCVPRDEEKEKEHKEEPEVKRSVDKRSEVEEEQKSQNRPPPKPKIKVVENNGKQKRGRKGPRQRKAQKRKAGDKSPRPPE